MVTDGGGWTVFQRRNSSTVDFERTWTDCKNGFGNTDGNFWLGLDAVSSLTSNGRYALRVDLKMSNETGYAIYSNFSVADESTGYKLNLTYNHGTIGDSMTANNGMKFTTKDRDNDNDATGNMADFTRGPWWHTSDFQSNLNSFYMPSSPACLYCMTWWTWKRELGGGIIFSEMKLRRED